MLFVSRIGIVLKETRKWLNFKEPVTFIVGNVSCDLDSAVCAVGLAYFYMNSENVSKNLLIDGKPRFLPLLNIKRSNLSLKTEVTYFMRKNGIDLDDLICSDEVPRELLDVAKFILVDHHVATCPVSNERIVQIFDHRPLDAKNAHFPSDCQVKISEVGSCATLIADEVRLLEKTFDNQHDLVAFLRGPIVLDTINFSESADKARPLDFEIIDEIEKSIGLTEEHRAKLFRKLVKARSDVSSLTALQLLSKDLKIVNGKSFVVAFPGFPILVEDFLQKPRVLEQMQQFGKELNCDMLVLMGLIELESGGIRRDIGLVPLRESQLAINILNELSVVNREYLQLKDKSSDVVKSAQGALFEQQNVTASRKQILPIIQAIIN